MVFVIVSFSRKINFISNARERCDVLKWHEVDGDPRINIVELDAFGAHDFYFACFFYLLPQGNRCNCERGDATESDDIGNQANRVWPSEVHAEIIVPGAPYFAHFAKDGNLSQLQAVAPRKANFACLQTPRAKSKSIFGASLLETAPLANPRMRTTRLLQGPVSFSVPNE